MSTGIGFKVIFSSSYDDGYSANYLEVYNKLFGGI